MDLLVRSPNENAVLTEENWACTPLPCPKKGRMERSRVKSMSVFFFDIEGVVWSEFLLRGATVNSEYYEGVMTRL